MITRSMLEMLVDLSATAIDVPAVHLEQGRAPPTRAFETDPEGGYVPMVRIRSAPKEPTDAFVSVTYREQWFWIDDRDLATKRNFALLMLLFALADTGEKKGVPLLTIPAQ